MQPVIMIECPRLLFPFAREIIANAVRNGGYPAAAASTRSISSALYRQRLAQEQGLAAQPPATA